MSRELSLIPPCFSYKTGVAARALKTFVRLKVSNPELEVNSDIPVKKLQKLANQIHIMT